jgi:predicted phosphoribosyltransferase
MQPCFPPSANAVPYRDRTSAGRWLAHELEAYSQENVVVLGIPRGGLLVAAEVARCLHLPLDVFVVRRVLVGERSRNIGAMASGGVCVLNQDVLNTTEHEAADIADCVTRVRDQFIQRERLYRQGRPQANIEGRTVILIDDGASTGQSLRAAVAALRSQHPSGVVVATPVASPLAAARLAAEAEDFVCPSVPDPFFATGLAYDRFSDVTDEEICERLSQIEDDELTCALADVGDAPFRLSSFS